jgi:anaerobic ribonucleoside-triphosphate reductase activating protein
MVVFEEIPDEITIAINITNCPCRCPGCHSKFLWGDVGVNLTEEELVSIVEKNRGVTCVCFMGGDANPRDIDSMAKYVHEKIGLKTAWYSGKDKISQYISSENFDYVKIGRYDDLLGPLNVETTNQRLYKIENGDFIDITQRFWKKHT